MKFALKQAWRLMGPKPRTKYLVYDPEELNGFYSSEHRLPGSIPYREEINWIDDVLQGRTPDIRITVKSRQFRLAKGNEAWQTVRSEAFGSFLKEGHTSRNDPMVRLNAIGRQDGHAVLELQKAYYHDQARSNLVMDYESKPGLSLRSFLTSEVLNRLPDLNGSRFANTIGMATLILYLDHRGGPVPYIVRRAEGLAVHQAGGLHASASCAAKWIDGASADFQRMLVDYMHEKIEDEVGLRREIRLGFIQLRCAESSCGPENHNCSSSQPAISRGRS